jgi:putative sigma-54 modulation protein
MKVHTESVQFKADKKLLDFIEKKMGKLENFFDRIIDAEVKLRLENSGQVKDKVAEVSLHVPGQSLFAKETEKTFEASVDNAIDDLRRQLARYKDKNRIHNGFHR